MKGKKYSREEWEAAKSLKKCGFTWAEVCERVGRSGYALGRAIVKYRDYENYMASYKRKKEVPVRKTEQLQFIPPELPKEPKKIQVKVASSDEELNRYKLRLATRQAVAIRNFIAELRDAGFRV